jgi:hypothetical protein
MVLSLNLNVPDEKIDTADDNGDQGKRRKRKFVSVLIDAYLLLMLVGLIFVGYTIVSSDTETIRLRRQGVGTRAVVENHYAGERSAFGRPYYISYAFQVNGRTYRGNGMIVNWVYMSNINIIYDPADPNRNEPRDAETTFDFLGSPRFWAGLALLGIVALILRVASYFGL